MKFVMFTFLTLFLCMKNAYALPVWGEIGPTEPITPVTGENVNLPSNQNNPLPTSYGKMILSQLPIKPDSLVNGRFQKYRATHTTGQPVCFVGADPLSLNWLKQYRTELAKHNTVCMIVQSDNQQDVQSIANYAGNILQPVNGVSTAQELGVTHYPALVYQGVVTQ